MVRHALGQPDLQRVVFRLAAVELQIQTSKAGEADAVRAAGGVRHAERPQRIRLRRRPRLGGTDREKRRRVDVDRREQVVPVHPRVVHRHRQVGRELVLDADVRVEEVWRDAFQMIADAVGELVSREYGHIHRRARDRVRAARKRRQPAGECREQRVAGAQVDRDLAVWPEVRLPIDAGRFEGVVENGRIRLREEVTLPENSRVYVIIADTTPSSSAQVRSPRLAHPEQAGDFRKQIAEISVDAEL